MSWEDLVIATKGGFVRGGFDMSTIDAVRNANYLRQCACMSARRLSVEQIDLYYLHSGYAKDAPVRRPGRHSRGAASARPEFSDERKTWSRLLYRRRGIHFLPTA